MLDFLEIYDDALNTKYCNQLISLFETNKQLQTPGSIIRKEGKQDIDPFIKSSTEISIGPEFQSMPDWALCIDGVLQTLLKYTRIYKKKYYFLENCGSWQLSPYFNLQRYLPEEGFFSWHCESEKNSNRLAAWMIYLNTVTDGGETEFNYSSNLVQSVQSRLVIWPAYWTHFHRGIPSKSETKYILTGWFNYN